MNVAYWLLVIVSSVLLCSTIFFAAVAKEYRFRTQVFPPRWAGGISRQIKLLREEVMSNQERLNELVRLAAEDLAVIKGRLEESEAGEVLDFSSLDDFVNALDALANSVSDEVEEAPPVEEAVPPVEEAPPVEE